MAKAYKEHWSGYREWEERGHAERYLVMGGNTGPRLSIDESSLTRGELYTYLTNKDGRGRKGTLVAVVRGTGSDTVSDVLASIPLRDRKTVREVSMDFSESMRAIVERSFPDARIVVDRFHVVRLATEAMQQERIALRKEAMKQTAELRKSLMEAGAMAVKMAGHAVRIKHLGIPRLENGDTPAELLARSQYLLCTSPDNLAAYQTTLGDIGRVYDLSSNNELRADRGLFPGLVQLFDRFFGSVSHGSALIRVGRRRRRSR